jgi:hypothetical protein
VIILVVKTRNVVIFLVVFILALFLRTIKLDSLPYGFHVDEAKAGWNAYSIFKTGHDDQGNFLSLYYNSFGDFRPAGIIYSIIPSVIIFGNTTFATRFPSALFGALSVIPLMFIFWQICRDKDKKWFWISGLLLAVNPWHIMTSRATSEVIIAIFWALFGVYLFLKSIKKATFFSVLGALIFIGISYFFYHNIRVLAPIFLIAIAFFYWSEIKINKTIKPVLIIIFSSICLTLAFFLAPQARGRLSQVSILSDPKIRLETINMPNQEGPGHVLLARTFHNKPLVIFKNVLNEYFNYFSTNFLVGDTALPVRYRTQSVGLITYIELLLIVFSLAVAGTKKEVWLPLLLLLISPLPAAITNEDTPNLHRALFMIPFLVLLETYGLIFLLSLKKYSRQLVTICVLALILNLIYFGHFYLVHQKFGLAPYFRNGGAQEVATKIYKLQSKYSKIIVTNSPDNLYPWFGFLNKIEPNTINNKKWENIEFSVDKCPSEKIVLSAEKSNEKILIVDAEGCTIDLIMAKKQNIVPIIGAIRRPDLSEPYVFWEKN